MEQPVKKIKKEKEEDYNGYSKNSSEDLRLKELELVRKRKQEREKQKLQLQGKISKLDQKMKETEDREQMSYQEWLQQEQEFHNDQDKVRSKLRIEQQRYQPIDYFIEAIMVYKGEKPPPSDVQYMKNPELIMKKLNNLQLLECLREAEILCKQEGNKINLEDKKFVKLWGYFIDMVNDKLEGYQLTEEDNEIEALIKDKNEIELIAMELQIKNSYNNQEFQMDYGYYEKALRRIRFQKAKTSLQQQYLDYDRNQDKKILMNQGNHIDAPNQQTENIGLLFIQNKRKSILPNRI